MKHIKNQKGITFKKYLKNYKKKTKKFWKKSLKKKVWTIPEKDLTPISEIRKRCPNGTRRNKKTDLCVEKSLAKKRCPNGSRRNKKTGYCDEFKK